MKHSWIAAHQLADLVRESAQAICSFETGGLVDAELKSGNDELWVSNFNGVLYCCGIGEFSIDAISHAQIEKCLPETGFPRAILSLEKLRLLRSHHSEVLKFALGRVIERAWRLRLGTTADGARTDLSEPADRTMGVLFTEDAHRRLDLLTCRPYELRQPTFRYDKVRSETKAGPANDSLCAGGSFWSLLRPAVVLGMAVLLLQILVQGQEPLPPFKLNGRSYTNAVLLEMNPVEILIHQEQLGHTRIKRQQMPVELTKQFPYEPAEARSYETEKVGRIQAARERQRSDAYSGLLRQETEIQSKIRSLERQLSSLQRELDVLNVSAKGKPRSAARQEADRMRMRKRDLIRHTDELREQLQTVRSGQIQFR